MNSRPLSQRDLLFLLLMAVSVYFPFLNKGVVNDDVVFLDYAARLTKNPLRCRVDDYVFHGEILEDFVVFESSHPPLIPYYLRAVTHVFGDHLVLLHLAFLPFLLLAVLALAELIQRYSGAPPVLALGLCLGPLFLPNATSLMTDVPLFAFWLAAVCAWERFLAARGRAAAFYAALTLGFTVAATFTAYQGLGVLALLWIRGYAERGPRFTTLFAAAALFPLALWLWLIWRHYHFFPYFAPPRESLSIATEVTKGLRMSDWWLKARVMFLYVGSALFFFLWVFNPVRRMWRSFYPALALSGWGWLLAAGLFPGTPFREKLYPWVLLTSALLSLPLFYAALVRLFKAQGPRSIDLSLLCWCLGFMLFQVMIAPFASPRYLLLLLAPMVILLLRQVGGRIGRWRTWSVVLPSLLLGFLVTWAERDYAASQRIGDLYIIDLPERATLHFVGEMGIKYSGEKKGYRYFRPALADEVDYLLVPEISDRLSVPPALMEHARLLDYYEFRPALPLRVDNPALRTSLYIHGRGPLPFTLSRKNLERFNLYQIFRTGNPDWLDAPSRDIRSAGDILPDSPVTQEFRCDRDGLSALKINLATNARVNHSTLVIELFEWEPETESWRRVFHFREAAQRLKDNFWHRFDFEPLTSKDKTYRLVLSTPDATPASAVTVWTNRAADDTYAYGSQKVVGRLGLAALCFPVEP